MRLIHLLPFAGQISDPYNTVIAELVIFLEEYYNIVIDNTISVL